MSAACEQIASVFYATPETDVDGARVEARSRFLGELSHEASADPFVLLARAAIGDIEAQRALADAALLSALNGDDPAPLLTLSEGLMFARMAASRGARTDIGRVIGMLGIAGAICPPEHAYQFAGEMLAMIELLADRGDEQSARIMATYPDYETAETLEHAQQVKARVLTAWRLI